MSGGGLIRIIHYSADAAVKEEVYHDEKAEVLTVVAEMYDRMEPDEFIEIDNGDFEETSEARTHTHHIDPGSVRLNGANPL